MERRRLAVVLAGLVLVGGAVALLRSVNGTGQTSTLPTTPPPPTTVRSYAAEGVLPPTPGPKPAPPARLVLSSGPHRLQVTWGAALHGGTDPAGAVGYDVSWGTGGQLDHDKLVAEPFTELDGLDPGQDTQVQVRSVDAFGQRSGPTSATGRAQANAPAGADNALVDHFDGAQVPDPRLWSVLSPSCAKGSKGTGPDAGRLVLLSECGSSPFVMRARTPFLVASGGTGELARYTVETDAPGEGGELDVDLVPGPADQIGGSPNDVPTATPPNVAAVDNYLPPGTIRVRIMASPVNGQPAGSVQVVVGPNTPLINPSTQAVAPIPRPRVGMSVRWDVVLRADGVRVLRDGVDVGGGNVVPQWTSATALLGFVGTSEHELHAGVDLIGFGGPKATPPTAPSSLPLILQNNLTHTGASSLPAGTPSTGPGSVQVRLSVEFQARDSTSSLLVNGAAPTFQLEAGGKWYPLLPAIPGTPVLPQNRYPLVAQLPPDALTPNGTMIIFVVDLVAPANYPGSATAVISGDDIAPGGPPLPAGLRPLPTMRPLPAVPPQLAVLTGRLLDAGGLPVPAGHPMPRGRVVLDVSADAVTSAQANGQVGALAGIEVWLDGNELAAIPTTVDGPGISGDWQVPFDVAGEAPGSHLVDVRAFSADGSASISEATINFTLTQ